MTIQTAAQLQTWSNAEITADKMQDFEQHVTQMLGPRLINHSARSLQSSTAQAIFEAGSSSSAQPIFEADSSSPAQPVSQVDSSSPAQPVSQVVSSGPPPGVINITLTILPGCSITIYQG
ncbi:hypothetical protein GLAREA_04675 [Glarea lozoyensis ATCC 20868]|uniref:Uncharacterized protein n=1 Tax=Glarea lozoyensis (strain ATCC 20868 / MF5171) TaxID=1116229 RepID=S3CS44_GLAL2|nr:uncharacterized protein GLAREA_04675 [Glarea lozoyensis ATCC 20868]EPE27884.1 hypothetical protein GLAREA_04675 [Glarea lozoyensis ATCC 20868]